MIHKYYEKHDGDGDGANLGEFIAMGIEVQK